MSTLLCVVGVWSTVVLPVVACCEVVVFVDSKTMPLMRLVGGLPGEVPILTGLESRLVPLMRDNNSSSKGLTPAKSEAEVGSCGGRTLRGFAEEVVCSLDRVLETGVIFDNSMGGGRPLGVASKSDKLIVRVVEVSFLLSEEGISWILVGRC